MTKPTFSKPRQSGIVLVVSLIMLLLLTIIGLTGVQVTSLEEKMAGNSKDQNLAFQAAEAAIRAGEANIASVVAITAFNGSNGLYGLGASTYNYATSAAWTTAGTAEFNSGFSVNTQPRYFVKHIADVEGPEGDISIGNSGDNTPGAKISYFTITARGTGGRDSSQVFLQTYYGKRF